MNDALTTAALTLKQELAEHVSVAGLTAHAVRDVFPRVVDACLRAVRDGRTLFFLGNGGSAADAQHLATELVVRFKADRPAIGALALTTDTSALTAIGNDFGFEDLFARQIEALCRAGDVAIGLSTSGNSENVIRGLRAARAKGALAVGFTGGSGGRMLGVADLAIVVPSTVTARIQEMHLLLGHTLCAVIEEQRASDMPLQRIAAGQSSADAERRR